MNLRPFVFESKKATLLIVVMALITFLQTVLPAVFPSVPAEVFASLTDFLTKLAMAYMGAQGVVDVAKVLRKS